MNDSLYHQSAHALAALTLANCEEHSYPPSFCHFNENNMGAVPDMLARLGLMRAVGPAHEFIIDWAPANPLPMQRHAGEPTLDDLGIGLDFCAYWYTSIPAFDYELERQMVIDAAVAIGRGIRVDLDYISEDSRELELIEDYWKSRARVANQLASNAALYPDLSSNAQDEP